MEERNVIEVVKKLMPATVSVMVSKHLADVEKEFPKILFPGTHKKPPKKLEIPEGVVDKDGMVNVGGGSGFIVEPDGIIVTNKHVVNESGGDYTVILNGGEKFPATILTRDPVSDIAILKIDAENLPTVPLGDAAHLELGQGVLAIGNALGLFRNTVSVGIVSGLSRAITAQAEPDAPPQELRGLIQTDAAINPGNSGGPLVDREGKAVGINAAIVYGAQNIGFAIPINAVRRDLEDLKKYGRIRRPLLGVRYIVIDENLQAKAGLPVSYGAWVVKESPQDHAVVPGSPAEVAGIGEHDIILACNGEDITKDHPIQDVLSEANVGDVFTMHVLRNGKEFDVMVTLTERK